LVSEREYRGEGRGRGGVRGGESRSVGGEAGDGLLVVEGGGAEEGWRVIVEGK